MRLWPFLCLLLPFRVFSQEAYQIETSDIGNFWQAYDALADAQTKADSIAIIQTAYIDKASPYFKEFIRVRDFTAREYVKVIGAYPRFWASIRPLTAEIASRKPEMDAVFDKLKATIPNYRQADVCFAIGCLRTGGTTTKEVILIGTEIAAADSTVEKSELSPWLKQVIGNTGDIVAMVAHEAIHTQQHGHRGVTLLRQCLKEGIADFLTVELFGLNINAKLHQYGEANACALWQAFEKDLKKTPYNISDWLYNSSSAQKQGKPADLGYFIGYKIAESYYAKQTDKQKALKNLLNEKKYKQVYKQSKYWEESCSN